MIKWKRYVRLLATYIISEEDRARYVVKGRKNSSPGTLTMPPELLFAFYSKIEN